MLAVCFLQTCQVGLRAFALAISSAWKAFPLWPLLVHYVSAIMYHIRDTPITSSFTISPSSLYSTHIHAHSPTLSHTHPQTFSCTHIYSHTVLTLYPLSGFTFLNKPYYQLTFYFEILYCLPFPTENESP